MTGDTETTPDIRDVLCNVDRWIDCWVGCASVVVKNNDASVSGYPYITQGLVTQFRRGKPWTRYLGLGEMSCDSIPDQFWRRYIRLRFVFMMLKADPTAYDVSCVLRQLFDVADEEFLRMQLSKQLVSRCFLLRW